MPLGSIGTAAMRWLTKRPSTTTSAPSSTVWSSPKLNAIATFDPCSGNRIGAPSASAASGSRTTGSGVVVDDDDLGRVDRLGARLGDDRGDDVADEADGAVGERRAG